MISVSKSRLKDRLFEYFNQVEQTGEEIVITSNRVPVLRLVPIVKPKRDVTEIFADLRGKVVYHGNVLEPETEEWGDV